MPAHNHNEGGTSWAKPLTAFWFSIRRQCKVWTRHRLPHRKLGFESRWHLLARRKRLHRYGTPYPRTWETGRPGDQCHQPLGFRYARTSKRPSKVYLAGEFKGNSSIGQLLGHGIRFFSVYGPNGETMRVLPDGLRVVRDKDGGVPSATAGRNALFIAMCLRAFFARMQTLYAVASVDVRDVGLHESQLAPMMFHAQVRSVSGMIAWNALSHIRT